MSSIMPTEQSPQFLPSGNSVVRLIQEAEWLCVNPVADGRRSVSFRINGVEGAIVLSREASNHIASLLAG